MVDEENYGFSGILLHPVLKADYLIQRIILGFIDMYGMKQTPHSKQ